MIVMKIMLNNFLSFRDFSTTFSYPKRIASSFVEAEYLKDRPNFRYKKIIVLMGANASGKTSLGRMLNYIFNFMMTKNTAGLISAVCDRTIEASFSIDFVPEQAGAELYRLETIIKPVSENEEPEILSRFRHVKINKSDNYERASARLSMSEGKHEEYLSVLHSIPRFGYFFSYPVDVVPNTVPKYNNGTYRAVLEKVLKAFDPSIERVEIVKEARNSYNIHMQTGQNILIQEGQVVNTYLLSSGTKAGIAIADILSALKEGKYGFYYCDERFSYVHSDLEKTILTLMVNLLGENEQMIFTTHNTDILDISLPKHSFVFLKKKAYGDKLQITSVNAEQYLKQNNASIRRAAENDLFSASPDTDLLYDILDI